MIAELLLTLDAQVTRSTPVELPSPIQHVWEWFIELHKSRSQGFNGWLPISNLEILAWCALTGVQLRPWEYAALRALDDRFVNGPPPPDEPVTPALFKRLFDNG
ncbi:phage tail assembly chaperone [Nitrobacteraceae bacterium UC4446_H13]